jgi:hypothetical protein
METITSLEAAGPASPVVPIHPSIVAAICKVQASLDAVAKSQFNKHGQYKFASVDDIYAVCTRKFAELGVMILPLELTPPQKTHVNINSTDRDGNITGQKTVTMLRFHYGYVLSTEEATWFDPRCSRAIDVQHTGAQTYEAAESYCQKKFLRALLKLPTGDLDLASMPQADTLDEQVELSTPKKRQSSAAAKRDGISTSEFNSIRGQIDQAMSLEQLRDLKLGSEKKIVTMPERWAELIENDFERRFDELRSANGQSS